MSSQDEVRKKVTEEILSTEETYVLGLETANAFFNLPEVRKILDSEIPGYNKFFAPILALNRSLLGTMRTLKRKNPDAPDSVIVEEAILQHAPQLKMYNNYLATYEKTLSDFTRLLETNKKFQKLHNNFFKDKNPANIASYLIMPVQRAPRYKLLLEELKKRVPVEHARYKNTQAALSKVEEAARGANEAIRVQENAEAFYQFFKKLPNNDPIKQFTLRFEANKGPLGNVIKQHLMYLNSNQEAQKLLRDYLNSKPFLDELNNPNIKSGDFQKDMLENLKEIKVLQLLRKLNINDDLNKLRAAVDNIEELKTPNDVNLEIKDRLLEKLKEIRIEKLFKQLNTNDDWTKLRAAVDNIEELKSSDTLNADAKAILLGRLGEIKITQLLKRLNTKSDWDRLKSVLSDIKALQGKQAIVISKSCIKKAEEKIRNKASETIISNLNSVIEIIQKDPKLQAKLGLRPDEIKKLQDHAAALGYQGNNPEALAARDVSLNEVLSACNLASLEIQGNLHKIRHDIDKKQKPSVLKKLFINLANFFGFQTGVQEKYKQQEVPKQYKKPLEQYEQLHQHYANIMKAVNTVPSLRSTREITSGERSLTPKGNQHNDSHAFLPDAAKKVSTHNSVPSATPIGLTKPPRHPGKAWE